MCGIAGLFNVQRILPEPAAALAVVEKMTASFAYRGPDADGHWADPRSRCFLGHRRLSIIDTSDAGRQPMATADERWVISFNGEIYNFIDLRNDVLAAGGRVHGRTDTEVLLQAIALWGVDALQRLDGMFAFAAFDRLSGELIMARDPFGEKPLYYAELPDGGLAFASELQAIERVPGIDLEVSWDSVAELLMFQYIGAPRSIYRSVRKLPPGHWMRAVAGKPLQIQRYFTFEPGRNGFDARPVASLADELEDLLVTSLRRRLISDVPLGAFLSGGVDSSTVCALVRRKLDVPLKTFSIGFEGASESEHETARAFAAHLGTEHHDQVLAPHASEFLAHIGRVLDEPNADSSCLPTYLLSQFARKKVTVAVSGDGGDELFLGYPRAFETLRDEGHASVGWRAGDAYYSNRILVSVEQHIEELFGAMPSETARHIARLRGKVSSGAVPLFCRLRQTDVENYMPGAVLPKVDRMSMQHSLEVRTPFLNVAVARFAERLPREVLWDGRRGKLLLREVAYRYLPRRLVDLPKQGFGLPMSRWAEESLIGVAAKMLEADDSRIGAALGHEAVGRFMKRQRSPGGFSTYQVWALVMLESWLREHPARLPKWEGPGTGFLRDRRAKPERRSLSGGSQPAESNPVALLELAPKVFAAVRAPADEAPVFRPDPSYSSNFLHMVRACPDVGARLEHGELAMASAPILLGDWHALDHLGGSERARLADAVVLVPGKDFVDGMGASVLAAFETAGIDRLIVPHPFGSQPFATVLRFNRASGWRRWTNLLQLLVRGRGLIKLTTARKERGRCRLVGGLPGVALVQGESCTEYALFEGLKQLPPVPTAHENIRHLGGGRYSIWNGVIFYSRACRALGRLAPVWMVKRTDATEQWLPVSARVELAGSVPRGEDLATFLEARIARAPAIEASLQPGDRIVVLTHALPPGGAERQWCYLACELRAMGYDVQFVTLLPLQDDDAHYLPLLEQGGVPIVRMDQWNGRTEGHRSLRHLLGRNSELRGLHESPFGLVVSDLIDALKTLRPKAVMAQLDYSNLVAGAASIAADVPHIVLSFRNYSPMRFSYLANEWYGPLYRALARSPRVHLTGNSTAGNLDYAEWLSLPRGRIELIPNAIDPAAMPVPSSDTMRELRSELSLSEGQPVILGVFRINEEKRPLLFVETCARVVERVPDVKVLMVGVGPMEDALRQRIDELGLASAVQLLGRREDVPALMAVASLLLLTSSFEGMPNVVMEAQLMGLPVVASRTGGTGDCMIDGETGYLVDVDDHAGYCERVLELLNDAGRRAAFGRRGEVLMRSEFSRRAMAERFLALVNHVRHRESSAALEAAAGIVRAANS